MELKEFKQLDAESKARIVNKRISEIEHSRDFKCTELNFSYSSALAEMKEVGYERHGDSFVRLLSNAEIATLQELAKHYRELLDMRYNLGAKIKEYDKDDVKMTSFKIDKNVLERWQAYCKKHSDFTAVALLNAALEEFMRFN